MYKIILILVIFFKILIAEGESNTQKQAKVSEHISTRTIEYVNSLRNNGDDKLYHFEKQSRAYLERGKARITLKKYDLAFQDLDSVLIRDPYNWDVYYQIARILIYKNQYSESLPYLDIAIENGLSTPDIYLQRGLIRYKENQLDKGLFDFDFYILNSETFDNKDDKYNAFYYRGMLKAENGEYLSAIDDMNEAISIDPKNPSPYVNRGNYHRMLGQPRLAIKDLDYAILLNYAGKDAYFYRGLSYIQVNNDDSALRDLNKFLELSQINNENRPLALLERGIVYYYLEDYSKALNDLNEAIELNPTLWKAYGFKGVILSNKEGYAKGLDNLDIAIRGGEENTIFYLYRGISSYILDQHDKGMSDLSKYIANPGYQSTLDERYLAYLYRGMLNLDIGEINESLVDFSDAISFNPDRSEAFVYRGNAYQLLEKPQSALIDLDMALALGSNNYAIYFFRGQSFLKLKNFNKAIEDFSRFITGVDRSNSDYSDAYHFRGIAKYRLDEYKVALDDFNYAIEFNPANLEAYGYRGICHYYLKEFNYALSDLSIGIESGELDNQLYFYRAVSKSNLYDFYSALEDINTYLVRSKDDNDLFETYIQRAVIFYNLNLFNDSLKDLNLAIELNPNQGIAYLHRANIHRIFENYNESLRDLNLAIEFGENNRDIYFLRGSINLEVEKYIEAYNDLNYFLENTPDQHKDKDDALFGRAKSSFFMGDFKQSKQDLDKIIRIDPELWEAYRFRGEILKSEGRNNSALRDLIKAENSGVFIPKINLLKGEINIDNNKFDIAYIELSKFINSTNVNDVELPRAFYNRGLARFFSNDIDGACIDWNHSASKGFTESFKLIKKNCEIISTNNVDVEKN